MREKEILMQKWICIKCPHTSHVQGDQFCQFSTCMFVETNQSHSFWNSQTESVLQFHWANELTICPDNVFQTPITVILSTHLLHEFIANVKCRVDWSCRKNYICLLFNVLEQYSANRICLTSVNMSRSSWLIAVFSSPLFSVARIEF